MAEENNTSSTAPLNADSVPDSAPATEPKVDAAPEAAPADDAEKPAKAGEANSEAVKDSEEGGKADAETKDTEPAAPADGADASKGEDAAPATTEANGAPAAKRANGKRKSVGGAQNKKLNKKKSVAKITHLDAQPGEYYFARLKSYAPWPSIVCDEEMLPQSLLSTRPVTTKQQDGTYKEAYQDGGKRAHERTFPVMFLHTNEFAWIPNTELTPLDPAAVKDFSEKGKNKNLIAAYHVAAEGHDLQHYKDLLADHQRALQEDQELRDARANAKADKDSKKKRKSTAAVDEEGDVEMDDADGEKEGLKRKASKKRKKDTESDGDVEKPAKTPKTTTKLKLTTPKTPAASETVDNKKAAGSAKATKAKASAKKSKAKAAAVSEDEDVPIETPKEKEKAMDPQEAKQKKEREILYLRYKLQKGFLSRDHAPKEEEMAAMDSYMQKLEKYTDLEVSIIRVTRINRVLKAIIKLPSIPNDEEYNFRGRAIEMLGKWKNLLDSDIPAASGEGEKDSEQPQANGVHKEKDDSGAESGDVTGTGKEEMEQVEEEEAEKPEEKAKDEKAAKDEDEAMPDADKPGEAADTEKADAPAAAEAKADDVDESEKKEVAAQGEGETAA